MFCNSNSIGRCIPHCTDGETDRKKLIKGHKEWGKLKLALKFRNSVGILLGAFPSLLWLHLFILWGLRKDGMITNILMKTKDSSPG